MAPCNCGKRKPPTVINGAALEAAHNEAATARATAEALIASAALRQASEHARHAAEPPSGTPRTPAPAESTP